MSGAQILAALAAVGVGVAAYRTVKSRRGKRVLVVITSHDKLGDTGKPTGFWLEELAAPYYALKDAGAVITLATPKGGKPPIDPKSSVADMQTDDTKRFNADQEATKALESTKKLKEMDESNFDAIFYPGGHGPLWDLADDPNSFWLIEKFKNSGKPIAAVCHGPGVFKHTPNIVKGRKVTGFTNEEEKQVGLENVVPFSVEDTMKEHGAFFSKGPAWQPYVVEDGMLITGQNPASSKAVAHALIKKL